MGGALIALTLAVSSLTRANLTNNEDAALEARASDTIALISAATNQMSATWASARLVVLAAQDDQRELARLIAPSFSKSLFANLSIVHVAGGRGRVEFTVGSRRPRLLAGFDAATWEQIAAVRGDQPQLIRIAPAAGSKVVGHAVAIDARPHEYVYTEFYTGDIIREAFPNAAQLSGAAYAGPRESPALLLAANAPSLPITGHRVVKHITILGGPATLVIGSRNPIVAGISARAPEIILAIGLLLALSIASSLFVLLRRRDAAVRRAATLGRLTGELGASEARFRELFEDASDIVFTLDTGGAVTALNRAGERAFGRDRSEIVGERLSSFLVAEDMHLLDAHLERELAGIGRGALLSLELTTIEDRRVTLELGTRPILEGGCIVGIQGMARDVTERLAFEHELARQAFYDSLTGLANRALLFNRIEHALVVAEQPESVAVLVIDLDDFKTVNDSLGHAAGDVLLGAVATRLRSQLRAGDTCARLGGDEFAVLLEGLSVPSDAVAVAQGLIASLELPFTVEAREVFVRASVGIAGTRPDSQPSELLRDADIAMYQAKARTDGQRWEAFRADMLTTVQERLDLSAELNVALARSEFELHYQPIVSFPDTEIVGVEALARWRHPTRGLLAPGAFIGLAEETGLIVALGCHLLEAACRQTVRWREQGFDLDVAVNVSGRQLQDADFVHTVAGVLATTGLRADRLTLEITESVLLHEASTATTLQALRTLGVRLAIDDFGSGYSSLDYLRRFPVDILKVDRSLIGSITSRGDVKFLDAIVQLADSLGLETVAEGIETDQHCDCVRLASFSHGQGYLFARPLAAPALEALLAARSSGSSAAA